LTHSRAYLTSALVAAALAGCGSAHHASIPSSGRLVPAAGSSPEHIVLSADGAQRIGLQTAPARPSSGGARAGQGGRGASDVVIAAAAIVYDPSGRTYAFVSPAPLTFVAVPVTVDHISGESAFLLRGPRVGAEVVTVGAEELFGVQTGVLAQS
jgi:hypothetical protein